MKSLILTASYLWKDTWKRWFEQPGSILARMVITTIMVSISVILLVAFTIQVTKVRKQMEAFGLDNLLVLETVTRLDPAQGANHDRFRRLEQFGELLTLKKLLLRAQTPDNRLVSVVSYTDRDIQALQPYLKYNHDTFLLTKRYPEGLLTECKIHNKSTRCICLQPDDNISRLIQSDTLVVPAQLYQQYEANGYTMIYYLKRAPTAPSIEDIITGVNNTIRSDKRGRIEINSAVAIKKQLTKLESQQKVMRYTMAALLGGAIALIYGTLSVLEFRQSMYIAALLRSFGTSRTLLGIRSVAENVLIANATAVAVIYTISRLHEPVFKALRLQTAGIDKSQLYWNQEILWIFVFINIGVLISSFPVFLSMRKPVGKILN